MCPRPLGESNAAAAPGKINACGRRELRLGLSSWEFEGTWLEVECGWRESNPQLNLGKVASCHFPKKGAFAVFLWTTAALTCSTMAFWRFKRLVFSVSPEAVFCVSAVF